MEREQQGSSGKKRGRSRELVGPCLELFLAETHKNTRKYSNKKKKILRTGTVNLGRWGRGGVGGT